MLAPVFRDGTNELRVLLIRRGMRGIHGGQLGLPGGKQEPRDRSLLETALRETEEEIGLPREQVQLLEPLQPRDTMTSGFRVHPYLARITPPPHWRIAEGEIAGVLTPTVRTLADPAARYKREVSFATWAESRWVECVVHEHGELLWGLTLRLLDSVLPRLLAGEWAI